MARELGDAAGTGGASFFVDADGQPRVAFHAWRPGQTSYGAGGARSLHVEAIDFGPGGPALALDAPRTSASPSLRLEHAMDAVMGSLRTMWQW